MIRIAKLTLDRTAVEEYPLTVRDLQERHPDIGWPGEPTNTTLEGTDYVVVADAPRPSTGFGETAVETVPQLVATTWTRQWTVQSVSLEEAKQKLRALAISVYWEKMQAIPTGTEMQNANGSYATIIQDREARFLPKLNQVRTDIQNALTIADAYNIWLELKNFV